MFNTIQLSKTSQTPLYLQLANGLACFIESGQLSSGRKLPSIRSLAKELKINRDTVVSAYKILEQRGLTYGQTGRGTYVSSLPRLESFDLEPFSLQAKNLVNFSSICLNDDHYPFEDFKNIALDVLTKEKWHSFYDYSGTKYQRLQDEVCSYLQNYSIPSTPKQIRIIENLSQLIQSLPRSTNRPGVCIESPCKDVSIFKQYGFELFEVPLEADGMDMDILEGYLKTGRIQYIYVTPYLQNPTGICYSSEKKRRLLALAQTYHVYIIEADTFSELLLEGINYIPICSETSSSYVIYIKHFSQLYLPNLHYTFTLLPNNLSSVAMQLRPYNLTDSIFYSFLHSNKWRLSKESLVASYHEKYLHLCRLTDRYLSPYFTYTCTYGGIYMWLTLKTDHISVQELCDQLIVNHVLVSPGSLFYSHQTHTPSIRISIARCRMNQIEKGIKKIACILSSGKLE